MPPPFTTLDNAVEVRGVGLHCGRTITARLRPSDVVGVAFARVDLPGSPVVRAELSAVVATTHATTIESGGARVSTVEHLLAALWTSGLTHVRVELDGPEVPILDGSALGWTELLRSAGRRALPGVRPLALLHAPTWWEGGGANLLSLPLLFDGGDPTFRLSVGVDFGVEGAGSQTYDGLIDGQSFARDLADARTFTLHSWLEPLRESGLIQGGSLDNALVIGEGGALSSPLRHKNELARHKALDCIGDLALGLCESGACFHGHLVALRAGHGAHRSWLERALSSGALQISPSCGKAER